MPIERLEDYRKLFLAGMTTAEPVQKLCGRIIRGTKLSHFESLTDDPDRMFVMLMGGDGLRTLLGKSGYEMLLAVGYDKAYIRRKVLDEMNKFKLVVFPESALALPATWENVMEIIGLFYPDFPQFMLPQLTSLKSMSFKEIEGIAGYDFSEVDRKGKADPQFMTYERFQQSGKTLADVRAFLFFIFHLRELYSGDGWTHDCDGNKRLMEYIAPNRKIADLGPSIIMDIDIKIPPEFL